MTGTEPLTTVVSSASRRHDWPSALALAALAVAVNAWRIGEPSVWPDEAATISAASRSLAELWQLVSTSIDMVHGVYYAGMHVWFQIFGVSPTSLRMASALAVGAAVYATVLLGARLASRWVGVLSGVLTIVIPQSLWAAGEGRSYALTMAVATWLVFAVVVALRGRRWWLWLLVALLCAYAIALFVYLSLVVLAVGIAVLLHRPWRARLLPLVLSFAVGAALAAPVAVIAFRQRGQVSWLVSFPPSLEGVLVSQWFWGEQRGEGSPAWFPPVTAVAYLALGAWGATTAWRRPTRPLALLAGSWALVPTASLLAATLFTPSYSPRYLTMCVPAVAILAALGIAALGARGARAIALGVLVILALGPIWR